ncbi:Transcription factor FapR [bioreactor metagenome]|uniref:Transcription factor FapR n=1 Tax=bioreactor metagenome TaxID=1076179 RepID=A0A644VM97_9ZZZZ|nr:transcription factor FapR [Aminivibrio sp.]MEA4952985.1 transcription factor FapR [Aminivibrio sp.]HRX25317.1 transcription factor FapR [Aminivibrio sp.]
MEGTSIKSQRKKNRQDRLLKLIEQNPLATDEELAASLEASVSTIRLDRAVLGVPELRERMRSMAQKATSRLRSLKQSEVVGDLLELEPNKWALSVLETRRDMAFRKTDMVWDHYIYAQASSIAIAVVEADLVIVDSMRGEYKGHARVGDSLVARAKVGVQKDGKYIVSVRTKVGEKEIFVGRFIAAIVSQNEPV